MTVIFFIPPTPPPTPHLHPQPPSLLQALTDNETFEYIERARLAQGSRVLRAAYFVGQRHLDSISKSHCKALSLNGTYKITQRIKGNNRREEGGEGEKKSPNHSSK